MEDKILQLINSNNREDQILGIRIFVENSSTEEVINTFKMYPNYGNLESMNIPNYCFRNIGNGYSVALVLEFKDIYVIIGCLTIVSIYKYQTKLVEGKVDLDNKINFYGD